MAYQQPPRERERTVEGVRDLNYGRAGAAKAKRKKSKLPLFLVALLIGAGVAVWWFYLRG
ncbi:MAG: hypothetical protein AAF916_13260 [Planctomycetota bacterium]